jgi:Lectin C-type domain
LSVCWFAACGRLGFALGSQDASLRSEPARDAALPASKPASARDAGGRIAAHEVVDAAHSGSAAGNGTPCVRTSDCASGACVAGVCCNTACTRPPSCHSAEAASCGDGRTCSYPQDATQRCDDGDPCTTDDRCVAGGCLGDARVCTDERSCTSDFCAAGACQHASSCDPSDRSCSYALHAGHGYWLCAAAVSYTAAQSECERIGASIVTIDDQSEQDFLWAHGMRDTWIGYTAADGGWRWAAEASQYEDWAQGEPDGGPSDACAALDAAHGGQWESRACADSTSGFACEIAGYVPPDAHCSYSRFAGHGYFICDSARTWLDASAHCQAIAAYLIEIDSADEATFLDKRVPGYGSYAIGLSDAAHEGTFVWSSGAAAGFSAWDTDQPKSDTPDQDYVVALGGDRWQTVTPDQRVYFVCESAR